ncbi:MULTISPECIES: class I SAM-dependent methyltransferase [unclassified Beijerinckia]|uniref:class I SAM-dependent methyltransferase n=1 Tax=unclassified Beijerinckia TaxID=2638183 RepID=UPI000895105E|nr:MULTISPECIES: class I SAM-dependent methyltransferase [unclassified Beijerinckia]MDH7793969.1 SAM-dependent methyltransferase [Beijerinckia sp. GAS462]SEB50498.1 Methyltransferase domain-containing protein [Beijerinckia sp. 28-YEA-48]
MPPAADNIISLYRRYAHAWSQARGTLLMERVWLDRFCALLPAQAGVLDIGCGPGEPMARYLIGQGCQITGVDSSPEMIALFAHHFPTQRTVVADMRTLSLGQVLDGLTFDGLLAWDSFFHLSADDQRLMFPIFRQHAGPRAALMFTSGPSHGEAIGELEGEPLYHASLDGDEYRHLLDAEGFDVVAHMVEDPACGGRTVWLAQLR